ncbi:hypothetical protein AGDE_12581 [Angomonas deanei]|uniref:Apg6 BARA domain containing protein, putative n=1 Tax=Angomonas deanei TaxID=59799 RepID=A0A7G2CED2_9TRYP|nr:hypothetical protein AGDE_12581 [Angomonas deanei]CAD2217043.1 Apg6 BARA domain containing protein, putative [Angomonas deanei]|eukprot:EPY24150.1 hypothetical protein AGDE_12581 [Angomonas deanei]
MTSLLLTCTVCKKKFVQRLLWPDDENTVGEAPCLGETQGVESETEQDIVTLNHSVMRKVKMCTGKTLNWELPSGDTSRETSDPISSSAMTAGKKFRPLQSRRPAAVNNKETSNGTHESDFLSAPILSSLPLSVTEWTYTNAKNDDGTEGESPTHLEDDVRALLQTCSAKTKLKVPLCGSCWKEQLKLKQQAVVESAKQLEALCRTGDFLLPSMSQTTEEGQEQAPLELSYDQWCAGDAGTCKHQTAVLANIAEDCAELQTLDLQLREVVQKRVEAEGRLLDLERGVLRTSLSLSDARKSHEMYRTRLFSERDEALCRDNVITGLGREATSISVEKVMNVLYQIDVEGAVGTIFGFHLGSPYSHPTVREGLADHGSPLHDGASITSPSTLESVLNDSMIRQYYDSREGCAESSRHRITVQELNTACGLVAELIAVLAKTNFYEFESVALHPKGDGTTIDFLSPREEGFSLLSYFRSTGNETPSGSKKDKVVARSANFFLEDKLLVWSTFGDACVGVLQAVNELGNLLGKKLRASQSRLVAELDRVRNVLYPPPLLKGGKETPVMTEEGGSMEEENVYIRSLKEKETLIVDGWVNLQARIPFYIDHETIDGVTVRYGKCTDDNWTLAMKKLLQNVQWCQQATGAVQQLLAVERSLEE